VPRARYKRSSSKQSQLVLPTRNLSQRRNLHCPSSFYLTTPDLILFLPTPPPHRIYDREFFIEVPSRPPIRDDMTWTPWTTSVPTVLVVCAVVAWWFTEPKTVHLNLIVVIGCLLFFWAIAPELAQHSPAWLLDTSINVVTFLRLDYLVAHHTNMLVTGAAILWYAVSITRLS
jgi:hypothetical protein